MTLYYHVTYTRAGGVRWGYSGFSARIVEAPAGACRCGHPKHRGQCPHPLGCSCDTFTKTAGK